MSTLRQTARCVPVPMPTALAACTTALPRAPAPEASATLAAPYGIVLPGGITREWGDVIDPATRDEIVETRAQQLRVEHADDLVAGRPISERALLLSGGGPDGAFGAGLLNGWTARGDRPDFDFVTGVTTLGFQKGLAGEGWLPHPPDLTPRIPTRRPAR